MRFLVTAIALCCLTAAQADAALKVIGGGSHMQFDTSNFSPQMKINYEVLKDKCTKCHSLERVVVAYTSGVAPISGRPFDLDGMKATTYTMLRKANSNKTPVSKDESKAIAGVLKYLLDESVR